MTATRTTDTNEFTQSLSYGLTDDISISALLTYVPMDRTSVKRVSGPDSTLHSSGFRNPQFRLTWRAIDERSAPVNLDLYAAYGPDVFDARSPTTANDGTAAPGGASVLLGAGLSRTMRQFTILGRFDAIYQGDRTRDNATTLAPTHLGSTWNYRLGLYTQTRLDDRWAVDANVSHLLDSGGTPVLAPGGMMFDVAAGDQTRLGAGLDYQVVPNRFAVGLTYQHQMTGTSEASYLMAPTHDRFVKDANADVVGVKFDYSLN